MRADALSGSWRRAADDDPGMMERKAEDGLEQGPVGGHVDAGLIGALGPPGRATGLRLMRARP